MSLKSTATFGAWPAGQLSSLETKLGEQLGIVHGFYAWGDSVSSFLAEAGKRLPLVSIEPWDYSLSEISSGKADSWLRAFAAEVKAHPGYVWVRPMHEANGDWYPWQVKVGQGAAYKAAWAHMAGILRAAPNLRLVWCVNADTVNSEDPAKFYPGNTLVDRLGLDGYNWNGTSFTDVFASMYSKITKLGTQSVWICETACGESSAKPSWVDQMFLSSFPRVSALVWFSENKEKDWRIDSSAASLAAFRRNLTTGFAPGQRVRVEHKGSKYDGKLGTISSVNNDRQTCMVALDYQPSPTRMFAQSWLVHA